MSVDLHNLGGTARWPKTNAALSIRAANTLRAPHVLPPRLSCDELGICHFPALDCSRKCQREAIDAGELDVPLPATPAGGNFWPDLATPTAPLLDVTRQRTARDTAWVLFWFAVGYLLLVVGAGYAWGKWGESAVRAFWRVVASLG